MKKFRSAASRAWHSFKKNKPAVVGLVILAVFIFLAIFADMLVSYDAAIVQNRDARLVAPCAQYPLGTDHLGRNVLARIIHGARTSLSIGVIATAVSLFIGGLLGIIAGYAGGLVDSLITRTMDILMCIPGILLSLCIIAVLEPNTVNLLIAITISNVPGFARILRATVINMVGREYVDAARTAGADHSQIIRRHILPNTIGMVIVQATMSISGTIIFASGLSFLGLGVQPPTPEWGVMLSDAKKYMRECPYLLIAPGLSIALTALSFNLVGDGLRDVCDPRSLRS